MRVMASYGGEIGARLQAYQELARKEAQLQKPPTDSLALDQNETQLKSEAEAAIAEQRELLDRELTQLSQAAAELKQKTVKVRAECEQELLDDMLTATVSTALSERHDELAGVVRQRMYAETELNAFRAKHEILEQAIYPDSLLNHIGWIVALSAAETIANALFYENSQGLLGGFLVALGISIFTMLSSVGLGYFSRYKNLKPADERTKGYASIALFAVLLLFSNSLFARFRSSYQLIDSTDAAAVRAAFAKAASDASKIFLGEIPLTDLSSFILFGLGIILMCLAFWKGYHLDDKYPGHGDKDRRYKQAYDRERESINAVRAKISEAIKAKQQKLQSLLAEPMHLSTLVSSRKAELETAENFYAASVDYITRDFEMVLVGYRQANVAIRATRPPTYFESTPSLIKNDPALILGKVRASFDALVNEIGALREQMQGRLQERQRKVSDEGNDLMTEGLRSFNESIVREAESKINQSIQVVSRQK